MQFSIVDVASILFIIYLFKVESILRNLEFLLLWQLFEGNFDPELLKQKVFIPFFDDPETSHLR